VTTSAGVLLWRRAGSGTRVEVLLVHPGGPYWARRDEGWWGIPKGEPAPGEDALAAAEREFAEELGVPLPPGPRLALGEIVQRAGKRVLAWAVEGDFDPDAFDPGTFEMEWPPRSGRRRSFPEVDRVAWCAGDDIARRMIQAQRPFVDRLLAALPPAPAAPGDR
jgi:predicted NUDIX family NTP pyrophosphohydrolase